MTRRSCRHFLWTGATFRHLLAFLSALNILVLALLTTAFSLPQGGSSSTSQTTVTQQEITELEPGKPIEHALTRSEHHSYGIAMSENQFAVVGIEQRDIDILVQVIDTAGKLLAEFDSAGERRGERHIGFVSDSVGIYQLNVKATYPRSAAGTYKVRLIELKAASEQDRAVFEAHKIETQAVKLTAVSKYDEAVKLTQRAMELTAGVLEPNDPYAGYLALHLGFLQHRKGDYLAAEATLQRALAINEKAFGKEHPQTALSLDYLGIVYGARDDYAKAEDYIQQALAVDEKTLGPEHPAVAQCLMQLAGYRLKRGDSALAVTQLQRALAIADKTLEPDDFLAIALVHNLGNLYLEQNDLERAEPLTERALKMVEKKYGPDSPRAALSLQNLGSIARMKKQYARALELLGRAEAIQEKALGSRHPSTASLLLNIGNVYKEEGDSAKALEFYQRGLNTLQTSAGPYHEWTLMALANIANTYSALGDNARATEYQERVDQVVEKRIELNLAIGSEREKLAYTDWMAERTDRAISLHAQRFPTDRAACELAALAILRRKGRVLDAMSGSLAALRLHMRPEDQKLIDDLNSTAAELAKVALSGPGKAAPEDYTKELHSLEDKREKLEAEISRSSAGYYEQTKAVTLAAVKAAIPPDSALLEFAVYRPFDPKSPQIGEAGYGAPRYAVYVIRNQGEIEGKDLGSVTEIDGAIDALRRALRDPQRSDVQQLARSVDGQIMQPVRILTGDVSRLLISPDGELNLLPFEALLDDQWHYLVERYRVSYLTTGRDLLRMRLARGKTTDPVVVADPFFGEPPPTQIASLGTNRPVVAAARRRSITTGDDLSNVYFAPLSGTAQEARTIQSLFPRAHVLTGVRATKQALQQAEAPQILHIATHGFFLQDTTTASPTIGQKAKETSSIPAAPTIENPLLRSGLALSGANLNKGGNQDGILTALEASNLSLWGTKLVTLSACDTGVGEIKNGEGVYGLRRAFFRSGAESLVMSLWPVSDYVTREMMTGYYRGLKQGLGRSDALRQVQLGMLKRKDREHPFYWASFIQAGEWANLDGQR